MELPADACTVDLHSPDRKVVRRRFVQSTLFPIKPHDNKVEISVTKKVIKVDDDDDDEECCGIQGRRSARKSKRKATPHKRSSKKAAFNGEDVSVVPIEDTDSTEDDGSPQKKKEKQRVSTRNGRTNGNKRTSSGKIPAHPVVTHQASQPFPDLWLEAKKTAEENSRMFSGKQIHPFFSSWKVGKKDHETPEVENNGCLYKRKERNVEFGPIHVFENVKDDLESIDWSNWTLNGGTLSTNVYDRERMISSFEGTIGSLNISNTLGPSSLLEDVPLGQYPSAHEDTSEGQTSFFPVVVGEELTPHDLMKNIEKDFQVNELSFFSGNFGKWSSDIEQQNEILQERIMSYYLNRGNRPENSLWTDKYQPEKALEVCGNSEAVKFINEWLRLWHAIDFRVSKQSSGIDKSLMMEDEYGSYDSDSDEETIDEAIGLKNVLLVTGPVGSGKSASIYACAKEQGFQVVEVNASDWRNGALLKQKFGEVVSSHRLKRSQENPVGSQSKLKFTDLNNDIVEVMPLSEEEDFADAKLPGNQGEIKTLILFEDVDATLCEDRGLISTIQQLADTGKRPIILTSNSETPVMPDNLDREEVCFTMPSLDELIRHIYLVCAAEKANVQPHLIERCIQLCRGDIRKTLIYLQFWCQSKGFVKDWKVLNIYSPLMFDLEAGHTMLPKLIPLELPSSLSEFVEAELCRTLCRMEENDRLLEVIEEEVGNTSMKNILQPNKDEIASIEAKKEAILRENCFLHADNDIIPVSNTCEFSNSSGGSPVAFTRCNNRRKLHTVMSDSEDEISNHESPVFSRGFCDEDNNYLTPEGGSHFPVPCPALNDTSNEFDDRLLQSGGVNLEIVGRQSSVLVHDNHMNFSAVGDSCNHKSDHCPAAGDSLNQLSDKFQTQQHCPGSINVNQASCLPIGEFLKKPSDHLHFAETKDANLEFISCPTAGNPMNPLDDHIFPLSEANTEDYCQYSEATNVNDIVDQCQSVDISCVPESTFIPETEVDDGIQLPSGEDLTEIVSPVTVENVNPCILTRKTSEHMHCDSDINVNARDEEMEDFRSENEHLEASTSGCQVMDECSRMDFCKRSKRLRRSRLATKSCVHEKWNELRQADLRHYLISEHQNALQALELTYRMSNLISQADLLFYECKFLKKDSLGEEISLSEETFAFGWHNQQVQMASTIAQHGYCLYANDIDALQSKMGIGNRVHLAWEMLASTSNSMSLGKLLRLDNRKCRTLLAGRSLEVASPIVDISLKRERETWLENIVQSIVPFRSYLAMRGNALHEYLSSLTQISRYEASRMAEGAEKTKRRRVRIAKNYLSSGGLDLSPDEIAMLLKYNCYGKVPSQS